jgi:phytoene desaturase
MQKQRVVVIGAGFGGLSAAAYLARAGYDVTVVEKNEQAGGRARVWREQGFAFDMGPSWYMMPEVFEKFFAAFGKKPSDYYELKRLDPSYRIYFAPNDVVDISTDVAKNIALFESIEPGAGEKLKDYLKQAEYQYKVSMGEFIYKNFTSIFDFFNKRMLTEGRKLHVFESLDRFTRRYFTSERLRRILQYSMVFLGGAPNNTPAIYSVINHADFNLGIWYPIGGIGAVVAAMQSLCEELGVKFVFNADVTSLSFNGNAITGVKTATQEFPADIVVGNGDYHFIETALLPEKLQTYPERYWQKRVLAPSAFMVYLGINKRLPNLKHHTLLLDQDWMKHFNDIFDKPAWPEHPSYYLCCPSQTDATVAPEGCENLFILVPVASGLTETPERQEAYYNQIMEHVEQYVGESVRPHVVVKRIFSVENFAKDYHAYKGSALGLSHTLFQTAYFRPRMQSKKVKNLFYTGQITQPGIGVPMTIISGQIVSETVTAAHSHG